MLVTLALVLASASRLTIVTIILGIIATFSTENSIPFASSTILPSYQCFSRVFATIASVTLPFLFETVSLVDHLTVNEKKLMDGELLKAAIVAMASLRMKTQQVVVSKSVDCPLELFDL